MPNYIQQKVHQVNYLIDFIEDPCRAPWTVYAECALAPLGQLGLALISFGMTDILIGATFPRAALSGRRLGRGKGRRRQGQTRRVGIPEFGNVIGARIPGAKAFKGRVISSGARALWIGLGAFERSLFWWMIIDQVTEALYDWTTLVNKSEVCQLQRLIGATYCEVQPSGYNGDQRGPLACLAIQKLWGDIDNVGGTIIHRQPVGVTVAAVSFSPWVDEPDKVLTGATVWIADPADPWLPLSTPVESTQDKEGHWHAVVKASPGFARPTRAYILPHGRNIFVYEGYLHGWAYRF